MRYLNLSLCREFIFPLIREEMTKTEPTPFYEGEKSGIDRLESILTLMQRDEYTDLFAKASYLFCSIIDGHPFSNGNKRLAVALMSYFLLLNQQRVHAPNMQAVREELKRLFPKLQWQHVQSFHHAHEYFFYHLALIIADRRQKGQMTFSQEQSAVRELLLFITREEES